MRYDPLRGISIFLLPFPCVVIDEKLNCFAKTSVQYN